MSWVRQGIKESTRWGKWGHQVNVDSDLVPLLSLGLLGKRLAAACLGPVDFGNFLKKHCMEGQGYLPTAERGSGRECIGLGQFSARHQSGMSSVHQVNTDSDLGM